MPRPRLRTLLPRRSPFRPPPLLRRLRLQLRRRNLRRPNPLQPPLLLRQLRPLPFLKQPRLLHPRWAAFPSRRTLLS